MRLIVPDDKSIAIVAGSALCPGANDWRGLFEMCLERSSAQGPSARCQTPCEIPCEMELPEPESRAETRQRRMMSRSAISGAWAIRQALRALDAPDSHLTTGLFMGVGASQGSMETLDAMLEPSIEEGAFSEQRFGRDGLAAGNPLFAFQLMNNYTMCHAAILEGVGGPNNALFSQGSGTVLALIEAAYAVLEGEASCALAGGADSVNHPVMQDELERRGFIDDGFRGSEGAGVVALEQADGPTAGLADLEHAAIYNARERSVDDVLDEAIREAGECHVVLLAPWGDAAREAMHRGLDRAGMGAIRVDLTAALGDALAATPALGWLAAVDAIESHAIESVLVLGMGIDSDVTAVVLSTPVDGAGAGAGPGAVAGTRPEPGPDLTPVITGVGVVSAFGLGSDCFFDALSRGDSAVGPIKSFDASTFETRVGGEVTERTIDAAWLYEHLPDADSRAALLEAWQQSGALRDRKIGFALVAAAEAWRQAGAGPQQLRAAVSLGLGLERALLEDFAGRTASKLPDVRYRVPVDFAARRVCDWLRLSGTVAVNVSACAAGGLSVAHAASLISRGVASSVVCGGADSMLNPLGVGGMSRLRAPSPRNGPDACRPFDRRRDGLAMGEGAAIFVVESLAQAKARGARPLANIAGWASTQDGFATTKPRPDGAQAALTIERALRRARMQPEDIDYINAHGTGTPLNDPAEVAAIRAALGDHADQVPTSSIKGATGHAMAASGALELAACLLAFERDMVPGTAHLADLDPVCDLPVIGPTPQHMRAKVVLSNSFGFGGQNVSLVLERPVLERP